MIEEEGLGGKAEACRALGLARSAAYYLPRESVESHNRCYQSSLSFYQCAQLCVQSTFGASNGLSTLTSGRVGAELMELDVRAIDETDATNGVL